MADKHKNNDGCGFFVVWAYLMLLSIVLSPIAAHFIKQEIARHAD